MSASAPATELLAFGGAVECRRSAGAIALQLRGVERGSEGVTQLLFAGATDAAAALPELAAPADRATLPALQALPDRLHDARVLQLSAAFRIEAREGVCDFRARSVQLHRAPAARFFQAVPPVPVARTVRLGWALLLWMLRLPGMARLLKRR